MWSQTGESKEDQQCEVKKTTMCQHTGVQEQEMEGETSIDENKERKGNDTCDECIITLHLVIKDGKKEDNKPLQEFQEPLAESTPQPLRNKPKSKSLSNNQTTLYFQKAKEKTENSGEEVENNPEDMEQEPGTTEAPEDMIVSSTPASVRCI